MMEAPLNSCVRDHQTYLGTPIRPATRDEIPEIASFIEAAFAPFRGHAPADPLELSIDHSRNIGERRNEAEVLVAESGGRMAGTVTSYTDASREGLGLPKDWAGFRTLAVHPQVRGRGLVRLLVNACLDKAHRVGAHAADLDASAFHVA